MEHRDKLLMLHQLKMINQNVEQTRRNVARKLGPEMLTTSTFVRSLLGYLLKEHWTEPHIIDLHCNEEGMLLAYESTLDGYLRLLCSRDELVRAVLVLAHMANLTPGERGYLLAGGTAA